MKLKSNYSIKKIFLVLLILSFTLNKALNAQEVINTDNETYTISGSYNFIITKSDKKTNKVLFKAETKIPDKSKKEMYYPGANNASFILVGDNIFIVYDVWQKSTGTKDCSVKLLNTKTGKFNEPKILYSTKLNSMYSSNEIIYTPVYSPDKSKLAVLKDNISPTYAIEPELTIYDTKTLTVISTKQISSKYENQKRIFDQNQFTMDNDGNISIAFHLMNEQTKITTKGYTADIPFNQTDLKNIKEMTDTSSQDGVVDQKSHGRFYKTLQDYIDNKPIPEVRIKNGSFSWSVVKGTDFKLIDDAGNIKKESTKNLPSDLFTYKRDDYSSPFIIRLIDNKPYIVLSAGSLNYYSMYQAQSDRYYSVGWDGELKKFKENSLEEYLKKYDLFDAYKKDKPRREARDDVNGYFNKVIDWQIKYFNLLNEKMQ